MIFGQTPEQFRPQGGFTPANPQDIYTLVHASSDASFDEKIELREGFLDQYQDAIVEVEDRSFVLMQVTPEETGAEQIDVTSVAYWKERKAPLVDAASLNDPAIRKLAETTQHETGQHVVGIELQDLWRLKHKPETQAEAEARRQKAAAALVQVIAVYGDGTPNPTKLSNT